MLLQEAASNYYHWMVEVLPKIGMLQRHGIKFDFIYTYYQKSFMQETLALLGFDGSKIIPAHDEYTSIQAEALIVPSFVSRFHYSVPATFEYLRHELLPQALLQVDASQFSKKVFISRKNSNRRKIVNEASIIELLEKDGFVAYTLEKLSVAEQIVLFSNAEIIVAEHGAGLTNIIFCQPATKVIEIFHSRKVPTYFDISMQLNLDYVGCIVPDEYKKVKDKQHSLHTYVSLDYIQFIIDTYMH
jgi:capsular polysaccharide biosynthesis protein